MSTTAAESRGPDPESRAYAQHKREEKRAAAEEIGVDAAYIDHFVETFYGKIQHDALLGPIFNARVRDWPAHFARMKGFWRSVLHNSGEFAGNPMLKHVVIPGLDAGHFGHWLELFYQTLRDAEGDPAATALVGGRARMIADSLLTGYVMQREGLSGGRAGKDLPHV
jgi:hemoglobin